MHGNKAKPICTTLRPSSKIWKNDLQRIKAKLKKLKVILHRNKAKLENFKEIFHRNKAKLKNLKF